MSKPQSLHDRLLLLAALALFCGIAGHVAAEFRQPPPGLGAYQSTHGEEISGAFAPYVEEALARQGIAPDCLLDGLFSGGSTAPGNDAVTISSAAHITGSWTYFTGAAVRVYELLRLADRQGGQVLVLYAQSPPAELVRTDQPARWSLAVVDRRCRIVVRADFETRIPHPADAIWDSIMTDLRLTPLGADGGSGVVATIDYSHSGGRPPSNQVFQARFRFPPGGTGLELIGVVQTLDEY